MTQTRTFLSGRSGCGTVSLHSIPSSAVPRRLAVLIAATLASGLVGAPKPKDLPKAPTFQPVAVGTKWVYDHNGRELVEEVTGATRADGETVLTIRFKLEGQGELARTVAVSDKGVFDRGIHTFTYDPVCLLRYPVKAGEAWDVSLGQQKGLLGYDGRRTVGEAEPVDVPAGTFRAFPVRFEMASKNGRKLGEPEVHTWWWAPDVGVVRYQSRDTDRKLKGFTPDKK
jgi:hypothetical protein